MSPWIPIPQILRPRLTNSQGLSISMSLDAILKKENKDRTIQVVVFISTDQSLAKMNGRLHSVSA